MTKFLLLVLLFAFTNISKAQISQGGEPYYKNHSLKTYEHINILDAVSESWKENVKQESEKNGTIEIVAKNIDSDFNFSNSGNWETLKNGDRIWRIKIKAEGALGIIPQFNNFSLPSGAKLFAYNEDLSQIIGAFTSFNNHDSNLFSTEIIYGNTIIIEYYEPRNQFNKGSFTINKIGSFFKDVTPYFGVKDFGDSQNCEVNINCSEGNSWQDEKKGVARISVLSPSGWGWCSGTLVNNTNGDCKPYFLTAYHCGDQSTSSNFNQWIFYFNYEFNSCSSSTEPSANTMTGSSLKSRANDLDGSSVGSDFLLLELNNNVPTSWDVYYNGWDNSSSAPSSGVSIHHPAGDVKKISTFNSSPSSIAVFINSTITGPGSYSTSSGNTHWNTQWISTSNGHGVTEGGSSGSPLFNNSGKVVGTLSGGGSFCTNTSAPDQYGKMSYHWQSNSSSSDRQLKPWLDPTNSGTSTLDGTYAPCGTSNTVDIALTEILNPTGNVCDDNFYPKVKIKNNGTVSITSATISYQVNSASPVVFNWSGTLNSGNSTVIDLANGSTSSATNSFTVTVSNPNGITDSDNSNNSLNTSFNTNVQKQLPLHNTFEFSLLTLDWKLFNNDDTTTWELTNGIGSYGTSNTCMYMDNWDYDAPGYWDWFISDAYDLSDTTNNELYFDLAYTYYKQTDGSNQNFDSLGIAYSLDCGQNFYWLWKFGGVELATLDGGMGVEFVPSNDDWKTKTIAFNEFILGQESVVFAFIAINGYGNNMYIDNIGVGKTLLNIEKDNFFDNIYVYPNPANSLLNIKFSAEENNTYNVDIINSVGQIVMNKSYKNIKKSIQTINLKSLVKGIYFIKINDSKNQRIVKFIKK